MTSITKKLTHLNEKQARSLSYVRTSLKSSIKPYRETYKKSKFVGSRLKGTFLMGFVGGTI